MATRRPSRTLLAAATAALVVLPTSAFAQTTFTPTDDPCLGDPAAAPFVDRDEVRSPHLKAVDCAFDNGVLQGRLTTNGERELEPEKPTTRAQMASIIVRGLEHAGYTFPAAPPDAFTDDSTSVHQLNINKLAAVGVVQGKTSTTFAPGEPVRRDQMASFMIRAAELAFGSAFDAATTNPFSDVDAGNVHRDNIIVAADQLGIAIGQTDGTFGPKTLTRRDQVATFVARLIDVTLIDAGEPASDPASGPTVGITGEDRSL